MRQLTDVVNRAFEARQKLQRAELDALRQRLASIEQRIAARDRIKDAIIDRRIEELLNPDMQWEPDHQPGTARYRGTTMSDKQGAGDATGMQPDGVGAAEMPTINPSPTTHPASSLILRSAEEFGRKLNDAEAELKRLTQFEEKGDADAAAVESARQHLAIVRQEYAAQIRLLELELEEALTTRNPAAQHSEFTEALYKGGTASESEVLEARREVLTAEFRIDRAQTLLDLYHMVNRTDQPVLRPIGGEDFPKGIRIDSPNELSWDVLGLKLRPISRGAMPNDRFRDGMQITEIRKDGPAAKANLRVDDIIVGIHHWETKSEENVVFVLNHPDLCPRPNQPCDIKLYVRRGDETLFATLRLAHRG